MTLGLVALFVAFCLLPALHNFVMFSARSKMNEAKSNLRALCAAQLARIKQGNPTVRYAELGVELERGNRFAYFIAAGETLELRAESKAGVDALASGVQVDSFRYGPGARATFQDLPDRFAGDLVLGRNGTCPDCDWLIAAVGNVDADPELDVWSAATAERTVDGKCVAACEPFHERNELPSDFWWRR